MEPFKVNDQIRSVVGTYPEAELIYSVAKSGGESARHAIARQWLSEGIPFAFKDCPAIYEASRTWIGTRLDVEPKLISITGSGRLGQSLAPSKLGQPFSDGSDLDLFVICSDLFSRLKSDFIEWSYDYESGSVKASNDRESKFWKDNYHRGSKNITRGFIDSKLVPNHNKYTNTRNVSQTMWLLKEKLDLTVAAPKISHASIRCYSSWKDYVHQISLNIQ